MKKNLISYKKIAFVLSGLFFLSGCFEQKVELSVSEYSQAKNHLTKYGEFIGFLEGCAARPSFQPDWKALNEKTAKENLITPDEMQAKVLASLEELSLSFDTLEKLDDVMREARNRKSGEIKGVVNVWQASTYYNNCMTVAISAQVLVNMDMKLPENAIERTKVYALLSPLR